MARSKIVRSIYKSPYEIVDDMVVILVNRWFKPKKFIDKS